MTAGETIVGERQHIFKNADQFGWSAVKKFTSEELAQIEKEERTISSIRKELKEKKQQTNMKSGFGSRKTAYGTTKGQAKSEEQHNTDMVRIQEREQSAALHLYTHNMIRKVS